MNGICIYRQLSLGFSNMSISGQHPSRNDSQHPSDPTEWAQWNRR